MTDDTDYTWMAFTIIVPPELGSKVLQLLRDEGMKEFDYLLFGRNDGAYADYGPSKKLDGQWWSEELGYDLDDWL